MVRAKHVSDVNDMSSSENIKNAGPTLDPQAKRRRRREEGNKFQADDLPIKVV